MFAICGNVGNIKATMSAVATDTRLVAALRTLVHLADRHEPEWVAPTTLAAYRAAVLEGRVALLEAAQEDLEPVASPAVLVGLPVAQRTLVAA